MAAPRIFTPQLPLCGQFSLDGPEVRHAATVLRLGVGDSLMAFDGKGGEALCQILQVDKRSLELLIEERIDTDRELGFQLRAFVSVPKGDRQRVLVDGLSQLGVSHLHPLLTKRSVVKPASSERLQRYAVESAKQCGRNVVMSVGASQTAESLSNTTASNDAPLPSARLVAHPYGESLRVKDWLDGQSQNQETLLREIDFAIGPEGGFTEAEIEQLVNSGWQAVSLGKSILRTEMAALHLAGLIAATFEHR
ncbi:MAG TPA: hypothetical protein DDW52_17455 [Planctomycetaceae bacterium]|nr:hypothetical protein [Planctomycetaceae bacterium]